MPCHGRLGSYVCGKGEKGGKRKRRERIANHGWLPMVGERGQRREKGECMGEIRRKPGIVRGCY